jgi:glycerol uptake facilitator-like aquaporin
MLTKRTLGRRSGSAFATTWWPCELSKAFAAPSFLTNTSVNPARSTGVALFATNGALGQLWLFWVAPLLGGSLGGILWRALSDD